MKNNLSSKFDIKNRIDKVVDILSVQDDSPLTDNINKFPLPSKENIIQFIKYLFDILFPGYYSNREISDINMKSYIGNRINQVYEILVEEINKSFLQEHYHTENICNVCSGNEEKAISITLKLIEELPKIKKIIEKDVKASYDGDPAAKGYSEIIFSYPCIQAITIHRFAHFLYKQNVPFIPRIMSEYSHSITGIDIHPGAEIGEYFFIDHGTGVVIGETCVIGNNVKIYQGVTLGALSFPKDESGNPIKGLKRHPNIEDDVTIYAGATILGGETTIGRGSIIGGNTWIVSSIPPYSRVTLNLDGKELTIKPIKK